MLKKSKNNKVSTVSKPLPILKDWKDCTHTTRKISGMDDGKLISYEICDSCGISIRMA